MGYYDNILEHHGILGQKWGVRRFQNEDGSLTAAGRSRYDTDANGNYKKLTDKQIENTKNYKRLRKKAEEEGYKKYSSDFWENAGKKEYFDAVDKIQRNAKKEALEKYKNGETAKSPLQEKLSDPKVKAAIAIGATLAVAGVAAYGGYKLKQINNVTTKGLSDTFESMAKLKYMDAAQTHGYSLNNKMTSLSDYSSQTVKKMAKDNADYWKKVSDRSSALGDQLRAKSKDTNNYTIKEKAEFIKEVKNNAKDFNWKKYTESVDYAKAAAQANEEYLNELLRRNAKALGM